MPAVHPHTLPVLCCHPAPHTFPSSTIPDPTSLSLSLCVASRTLDVARRRWLPPRVLWQAHSGPGDDYRLLLGGGRVKAGCMMMASDSQGQMAVLLVAGQPGGPSCWALDVQAGSLTALDDAGGGGLPPAEDDVAGPTTGSSDDGAAWRAGSDMLAVVGGGHVVHVSSGGGVVAARALAWVLPATRRGGAARRLVRTNSQTTASSPMTLPSAIKTANGSFFNQGSSCQVGGGSGGSTKPRSQPAPPAAASPALLPRLPSCCCSPSSSHYATEGQRRAGDQTTSTG